MKSKVLAPDKRASGLSAFGPTYLEFKKGVAEVEDLTPDLRFYLVAVGYEVVDEETAADLKADKAAAVKAAAATAKGAK